MVSRGSLTAVRNLIRDKAPTKPKALAMLLPIKRVMMELKDPKSGMAIIKLAL
jgi:hypothetical protein